MFRTVCCIFSVVVVVIFLDVVLLNEILRVSKLANAATPPSSIQDVPSYNLGGDTDHSEAFCGIRQVSIQMSGKLLKLRCYHLSFFVCLYLSLSGSSSVIRHTVRLIGIIVQRTITNQKLL
jgi:hypothetical protein